MDRKIIELDASYFFATSFNWQIDWRGQAGATGVTGAGQVVFGNQPRWTADLSFATMRPHQIRGWRSTISQLRGRYNVLRVRMRDPLRPTFAEFGSSYEKPVPHGDGTFFSDGSGYANGVTAPVLDDAPAGATSIRIDAGYVGNVVTAGHIFSINDWPYQAVGIEGQGTDAVLYFETPLRRPASVDDEIDFDATGLMALEGDLEGALRLEPPVLGTPSLKLVEWVGPGRE